MECCLRAVGDDRIVGRRCRSSGLSVHYSGLLGGSGGCTVARCTVHVEDGMAVVVGEAYERDKHHHGYSDADGGRDVSVLRHFALKAVGAAHLVGELTWGAGDTVGQARGVAEGADGAGHTAVGPDGGLVESDGALGALRQADEVGVCALCTKSASTLTCDSVAANSTIRTISVTICIVFTSYTSD